MPGEPYHAGCGQRTERVIGTMQVKKMAPGIWDSAAVWTIPKMLRFRCPMHGLVTWDQTHYASPSAKAIQAARNVK